MNVSIAVFNVAVYRIRRIIGESKFWRTQVVQKTFWRINIGTCMPTYTYATRILLVD